MPFTAGQRLKASALNANMPQLLGSMVLSGSAASITIAVPSGFNQLQGIYTARKDVGGGGAFAWLRLNGDTSSNYLWQITLGNNTSTTTSRSTGTDSKIQIGIITGSTDTANYVGSGTFTIGSASSTSLFKAVSATSQCPCTTTNSYTGTLGGQWLSTAAITSVTLLPDAGNFVAASSFSLYGMG